MVLLDCCASAVQMWDRVILVFAQSSERCPQGSLSCISIPHPILAPAHCRLSTPLSSGARPRLVPNLPRSGPPGFSTILPPHNLGKSMQLPSCHLGRASTRRLATQGG